MLYKFMDLAIEEAKKSGEDIPVGCVIVKNEVAVASASNRREKDNDPTAHAEIVALKKVSFESGNWRLTDCDLYVTLEPCPMCAWAIINSGIKNVYFGAYDLNYGAFGSKINLLELSRSKTKVFGGIREFEAKKLLNDFFQKMREN